MTWATWLKAIEIRKEKLLERVPLIGFAGASWTIFAYMIEGSGSKTFSKCSTMLYRLSQNFHSNCSEWLLTATINYLKATKSMQEARPVQIFDSWAGEFWDPTQAICGFSFSYISQICTCDQRSTLKLFFAKEHSLPERKWVQLNCDDRTKIGIMNRLDQED